MLNISLFTRRAPVSPSDDLTGSWATCVGSHRGFVEYRLVELSAEYKSNISYRFIVLLSPYQMRHIYLKKRCWLDEVTMVTT